VGGRWWAWPSLIYLVVNVPLIVLTFDAFNLNGGNYSASFLILGLNPYRMLSSPGLGHIILSGAGYGILPYDYLGYASYVGLGFNPLAASIILKSLGACAGFLAAGFAYRIALNEGSPHARTVFTSLLLNPFLIFVNAVWGETEIFVVLLLLCAVFFLRYGQGHPANYPALLLGSVALALTAFAYFFTILLVPALLIYIDGGRRRLTALAAIVLVFAVFAIPYLFYGLTSSTSTSFGGAGVYGAYSILNLLPASTARSVSADQEVAIALAGVLSLLIPWLFRRWKINLGTALLTVTWVSFSLTFFLPGDAFILLGALVVLAVALGGIARMSYWKILVLQLFLLPLVLIVQMVNGPGQVSGVLYWTYFLHHQNITLYRPLGGFRGLQVYLATYFAGALAVIFYLLWEDRRAHRRAVSALTAPTRLTFLLPAPVRPTSALLAVLVAVLVVSVPVALASNAPTPPALTMTSQFDPLAFYAYDVATPDIYPLAAPDTYSITPSAGTLTIEGASLPLGFARDIQAQSTAFNLSASVAGGTGAGPVPVWQTNDTEVAFSAQPTTGGIPPWTPNGTVVPTVRTEVTPVFSGPTSVYVFNGTRILVYQLPESAVNGTTVYFGVELNNFSPVHTQLWWMYDGGIQFQAFLANAELYLGEHTGTSWTYVTEAAGPGLSSWFLTGFHVNTTSGDISAFVNGLNLSSPFRLAPASNVTVTEGGLDPAGVPNEAYALTGNLTATYAPPSNKTSIDAAILAWTSTGSSWTRVGNGTAINITYTETPTGLTLSVDRTAFSVVGGDGYVLFGKLGVCPNSVFFQFHEISFARAGSGTNLAYVVLGFAVLLPGWLIAWSTFELWRSRRASLEPAAERPKDGAGDQAK
jgi:hypothetical protein